MSEESQENYNSGDVVWVKLGSSWWPGEVKDIDELPNDILEFKKPPLVIVKFFDEDLYEYVRTWANIYPYNSEKKNEFIKKGMAAYRAKTPHMEKFPKDVLTAEARMGGNPNILSEPMFLPEKKRNYSAEMYGTPSPKNKSNKEKKRSSTSKPSSQKDTAHITHRRFLGVDDYRAYICIQYPGKDRIAGDREDDEVLRINREPEQEFNCHSCSFTTKRLEVMILHTKSHIQGVYVSSPRSAKHPAVRRKKESMKKPRNSDDMMDSDTSSSDSDYVREKKRKPKSQGARKMKTKKAEKPKEEPKTSNDIRTELLAVWDDSDEDEEFDLTPNRSTETDQSYSQSITDIILGKTPGGEKKLETSDDADKETTDADTTLDRTQDQPGTSRDVTGEVLNQKDKVIPDKPSEVGQETESKEDVLNESEVGKETVEDALVKDPSLSAGDSKEPTENSAKAKASKDKGLSKDASEDGDKSSHRMDRDIQEAIKSCFDFDEDEEDDGAVMGRTAAGRKIPRVIPPAERRKSQEMPEDDANREKSLDETEQSGGKEETETRSEDVDATFKELMEMTAVPELPDIHNTLKCEQNFHNIKTIKFPDKPDNTFDPFTPDAIGPSISDVAAASMSDAVETSKADDVDTSKLDVVDTPKLAVVDSPKSDVVDSPKSDVVDASKSDVVDASKLDVVDTSIVDVVGPSKPDSIGPSKPEATGSSKPEKKEPSESATKLINPKKRFVKSFEDFELMQNEIRRKEEEAKPKTKKKKQQQAKSESTPIEQANPEEILKRAISDEPQEDYSPEDNIELSKLKSKIMSRIIEEANINDECRTKIMSKIQDSSKTKGDEQDVNSNEEVKTGSHRTPRSKILELYRNDTNKQRAEERREIEKMEEEHKNEKAEESANSKEDNAEDRLKERPTRSEAMPPKKGKWSRRGSHPKKDRNALLLTSLVMDDVPKQAEEDKKHEESVPVDDQTPLDAADNLASKSKDEELKRVPTEEDEENTLKHKLEVEESNKLLPTEEDSIKTSDERDAKDEIAATVSTQSTDEQTDSTPIQEEVAEEIVAEEPSADNETEKTVTAQDSEVESLFPTESEFDCLKEKELDCLPQIEEVIEEEKIEALENDVTKPEEADAASERIEKIEEIKNDVAKTDESDVASIDAQMGSSTEEKDITDAIQSNTMILPMDESVAPPKEIFAEGVEVTLEEVVEETQQIEAEEPRLPSPIVDVMVPPSPVLPKEAICSPPKKSKKRKLSESLVAAAEASAPIPESDNFCSAEKKKKETDLEGKEIKEPSPPAPDKPAAELTTATVDKFREYKAETNDMEVAKEAGAAVPTPEEVAEHNNEVEIQCGSSSPESFKFSIQTNLSNLTSREEISALALATLSEIKADLEASDSNMSEEKAQQAAVVPPAPAASELVGPIEGNLTVMSERDLADGQVEITTEQVISPKRPVMLSNFSMDFSDSASDSNNSTNDTIVDYVKCTEFGSGGTEFTSKAMTKQIKKVDRKRENAYERLELLNILEGNSDTERKPRKERLSQLQAKKSIVDDICDFEEHIPSQIVCAKNLKRDSDLDREYPYTEKVKTREKSTTSKLLERLTVTANKAEAKETLLGKLAKKNQMFTPKTIKINKYIGKAKPPPSIAKPIILSEQIVKPATETAKTKHKKALDDIEDVEAFVIHKDPKRIQEHDALDAAQSTKAAGKAKILQQTIITPAGEIIQPTVGQAQTDDNIFDIDSMPIVLSDEILTPESIENMPIMIGSETKSAEPEKVRPAPSRIITAPTPAAVPQPVTTRNQILIKQSKTPRILQSVGSKMLKNSPMLSNATKPGKYIILPQSGVEAAKYVAKKGPVVKRTNIVPKSPAITPEPSGNKIMIVTNQQGQQQRLLLTPAQQKMLGYQNQKTTKTLVKGNVMQKSVLAAKSVSLEAGTSGVLSKSSSLIGQKVVVGTSPSTGLLATTSPQLVTSQGRIIKGVTKKVHPVNQKLFPGGTKTQKTILIKNQHGQTVRKIQGTDDELLDKQVAEQLEAIKASSGMKFSQQPKQIEPYKAKAQARRSYSKKPEPKPKLVPPLTSIQPPPKPEPPVTIATLPTPKKLEPVESKPTPTTIVAEEPKPPIDRPLNQLVIQDAVGNQTTITEGQILALPSETVDGQPQSYMLVTLDESGNLTPLNSEALMSLDPNLGLGGDLSNMVLQIDQGALGDRPQTIAVKATVSSEPPKLAIAEPPAPIPVPEASITTEIAETVVDAKSISEAPQPIVPCTNGDPGQQLIVTGDPIATQKFLESLTEGTTDLANILANAEGNSILIQADGQQILINTNSDNQMLLSVNNDSLNASESTEGGGNPIFATQPSKNQDILAAALADTDVFQQEQHAAQSKITSQLSPSNALYPMNVSNVLETSLTLSSPIMTPLEIPTTNSKKIPDDEADILTQVPKNVDLPITITDPNISQTVANQQVALQIANELHTNLELGLPVSESVISSVSTCLNSPSYVYSLPALDESVDINQKPFNSSMPLLNEDIEEATAKPKGDDDDVEKAKEDASIIPKPQGELPSGNSFLDEEEGRFTLGGEMCSSLSEPPPEMFDLPEDNQNLLGKRNSNIPSSLQSTPDASDNASKDGDTTDLSTQAESSNDSCEIPLQPRIVAKSSDLSENLGSFKRNRHEAEEEEEEEENKRCKFD